MIKRILLSLLAVVILLAGIILFRTYTFTSKQIPVEGTPGPAVTSTSLAHFTKAITFKTVSFSDTSLLDSSQFIGFRKFLERTYPLVHARLQREIVAKYSLLYKWDGSDKNLNPIVLMAHQDVVPIEDATTSMWTVDPFSGIVKDGFIWGRGTADNKINLISIMESAEKLLTENFQPERTIFLAFGHDEEVYGTGAIAIAALLKSRNIKADLVLDEGGIITKERIPGMKKPVALIGTSEKGSLSIELKVDKNGGHASMPESETAIDILSKGVIQLRENQFEPSFSESTQGFIEYLGPEMPFGQKMAFANQWLFKSIIYGIYEKTAAGNALIRTTIAPTILKAGVKENVVPTIATAIINFRLLPGDSAQNVIDRVKEAINDERVQIIPRLPFREATKVTSSDGFAFRKVQQIMKQTSDSIITAPFLMIAATDSRYFSEVSDGIIKFSPMVDPIGFHGIDERVSVESYRTSLWFFEQLIRNTK